MFHPLFIAFITISTRPMATIKAASSVTPNQKSSAVTSGAVTYYRDVGGIARKHQE